MQLFTIIIILLCFDVVFASGELISEPETTYINIPRGESFETVVNITNDGNTTIAGNLVNSDFDAPIYPVISISEDYIELEPGETINITIYVQTDDDDVIMGHLYIIWFKATNKLPIPLIFLDITVLSNSTDYVLFVLFIFVVPIMIIILGMAGYHWYKKKRGEIIVRHPVSWALRSEAGNYQSMIDGRRVQRRSWLERIIMIILGILAIILGLGILLSPLSAVSIFQIAPAKAGLIMLVGLLISITGFILMIYGFKKPTIPK